MLKAMPQLLKITTKHLWKDPWKFLNHFLKTLNKVIIRLVLHSVSYYLHDSQFRRYLQIFILINFSVRNLQCTKNIILYVFGPWNVQYRALRYHYGVICLCLSNHRELNRGKIMSFLKTVSFLKTFCVSHLLSKTINEYFYSQLFRHKYSWIYYFRSKIQSETGLCPHWHWTPWIITISVIASIGCMRHDSLVLQISFLLSCDLFMSGIFKRSFLIYPILFFNGNENRMSPNYGMFFVKWWNSKIKASDYW